MTNGALWHQCHFHQIRPGPNVKGPAFFSGSTWDGLLEADDSCESDAEPFYTIVLGDVRCF